MQLPNTDLSGVEGNYRIHLLEAYDYMDYRCVPGYEADTDGIERDKAD